MQGYSRAGISESDIACHFNGRVAQMADAADLDSVNWRFEFSHVHQWFSGGIWNTHPSQTRGHMTLWVQLPSEPPMRSSSSPA